MANLILSLLGLNKKRRRAVNPEAKQRRRQALRRLRSVCLREAMILEAKAGDSSH
jgi:hypothetical protein